MSREILEEAVCSVPGAQGAVFADWEGEEVDHYLGDGDLAANATHDAASEFEGGRTDMRILAAHWGIVLFQTVRRFASAGLGDVDELTMCFSRFWVLLRRVTDHYYVVILIDGDRGNLGKAISALDRAEKKLREEM